MIDRAAFIKSLEDGIQAGTIKIAEAWVAADGSSLVHFHDSAGVHWIGTVSPNGADLLSVSDGEFLAWFISIASRGGQHVRIGAEDGRQG